MRLVGVEETSPDWAIHVEINPRGNIATVTAYQRKLLRPTSSNRDDQIKEVNGDGMKEMEEQINDDINDGKIGKATSLDPSSVAG